MAQRVTGQRFRQRKLSTKQSLPVLRESEVDGLVDDEAQRHVPRVETGVEKAEETEHHLQAVISASAAAAVGGKVAQLYIPTPDVVQNEKQYDKLYPKAFKQPATYIRTSSTVEDGTGCPYTADHSDFVFLKVANQRNEKLKCTVDEFEILMNSFEETAASKQPYAAVSNAPVLSYDDVEAAMSDEVPEEARTFAKVVYEHWKSRRVANGNRSLSPSLKFETNVETDDADPYVCFRRREVRQTRKTRGRDAQATEKCNTLRWQLEQARDLMRKTVIKVQTDHKALLLERDVFLQRKAVREMRRTLNIKGDDDDLINQKPAQKPKPKAEPNMAQRGVPGLGVKTPLPRADGRPFDSDLLSLQDQKARKKESITSFIDDNLNKHQDWNKGYVDMTWRPITPPLEQSLKSTFRPAIVVALPTPPASEEGEPMDIDETTVGKRRRDSFDVQYETSRVPPWENPEKRPSFRRRTGRGGRVMIDRRGIQRDRDNANEFYAPRAYTSPSHKESKSLYPGQRALKRSFGDLEMYDRPTAKRQISDHDAHRTFDRFKYDRDSDEDEELYVIDPHSDSHMKYRVLMERSTSTLQLRRSQGGQPPGHHRSASGQHLIPPPA
ncbi:hypothetical protein EJ05DRAFT_89392 [Pseudovirgaria hyperparasitica]|uniref:Enhancer of polycomb-like protein n=1 Tax=Pseudovirgaria hyperparasitica TaxID=470096 RepID=A0A6A6W0L0_9PEZI|nr:uncharacterized protein EJ05DRAFT_89392 [Pseudovirgaria hyperparasitica]KAF2756083.1 hypothetical protein EJ05DRAFT_89392 [Pseudovirgaria hyperparasitica]